MTLTEAGAAALAALWPVVMAGEKRVPAGLTPMERIRLQTLLLKMIATPAGTGGCL